MIQNEKILIRNLVNDDYKTVKAVCLVKRLVEGAH